MASRCGYSARVVTAGKLPGAVTVLQRPATPAGASTSRPAGSFPRGGYHHPLPSGPSRRHHRPPRPFLGAVRLPAPRSAMTEGAATLTFDRASKRYPGSGEPAIRELSLEVPAGELCILVGPSGCGKTTAMRLVNRMIELTAGDIRLDGVSIRDREPADLRRHIGYAIQQIGLFPHQTVAENIATVPHLVGWDKAGIRARTTELLELL